MSSFQTNSHGKKKCDDSSFLTVQSEERTCEDRCLVIRWVRNETRSGLSIEPSLGGPSRLVIGRRHDRLRVLLREWTTTLGATDRPLCVNLNANFIFFYPTPLITRMVGHTDRHQSFLVSYRQSIMSTPRDERAATNGNPNRATAAAVPPVDAAANTQPADGNHASAVEVQPGNKKLVIVGIKGFIAGLLLNFFQCLWFLLCEWAGPLSAEAAKFVWKPLPIPGPVPLVLLFWLTSLWYCQQANYQALIDQANQERDEARRKCNIDFHEHMDYIANVKQRLERAIMIPNEQQRLLEITRVMLALPGNDDDDDDDEEEEEEEEEAPGT